MAVVELTRDDCARLATVLGDAPVANLFTARAVDLRMSDTRTVSCKHPKLALWAFGMQALLYAKEHCDSLGAAETTALVRLAVRLLEHHARGRGRPRAGIPPTRAHAMLENTKTMLRNYRAWQRDDQSIGEGKTLLTARARGADEAAEIAAETLGISVRTLRTLTKRSGSTRLS